MQQDKYIPIKPLYLLSFLEVNFYTKPYYVAELFLLDRKVKRLTRGQFLTMHVTTPPTESPFTRTASIAAIIFSAYSGSGHRTMLLSIWTNFKTVANQEFSFRDARTKYHNINSNYYQ